MLRRGKTILEERWKDTPDFVEVAKNMRSCYSDLKILLIIALNI